MSEPEPPDEDDPADGEMPTGEAFIKAYSTPELLSTDY